MPDIQLNTLDAYELLHKGVLALARIERQGMCIDVEYCQDMISHIERQIKRLERELGQSDFIKMWKSAYGQSFKLNSPDQLANILYNPDFMGIEPLAYTEGKCNKCKGKGCKMCWDSGNNPSVDEEALEATGIEGLVILIRIRKLKKIKDTYLSGFLREQVDGVVHPIFNLNLARTFRPCISKGTKILVVRDFEKSPNGIPIEEVKVGDYVYCFDDNLNPTIEQVKWAGKTGHDYVVRIHWKTKGRRGHLDVTPEHLVRIINGKYVEAQNLLLHDLRSENESKRTPRHRVLSAFRIEDSICFTGHLKNGHGIKECRLIYKELIGDLKDDDLVHHIDGNHLNHDPKNLQKHSRTSHAKHHAILANDDVKKKRIAGLDKGRKNIKYKTGDDNPLSLKLSRFQCLRLLAKAKGKVTFIPYDFTSLKLKLKKYNIDSNFVQLRYDKTGKLISKNRLQKLHYLGRNKVSQLLGRDYYSLLKLYDYFKLDKSRRWGNQFGEFKPGNHIITKIVFLKKSVDLYDICTEKYHNFIANEICVHNSTDSPNLANVPKRDPEAQKICRRALKPRPGHLILSADFKGIEVGISCCYHKDPRLIEYVSDKTKDMHRDMAMQLYILKQDEVNKAIRHSGKNEFVFPEFYGDYWRNCASALWISAHKDTHILANGKSLVDQLASKGIKSLLQFEEHVKEVEDDFWHKRFPIYTEWKEEWREAYFKNGFFDSLTGFRYQGVMDRNQVINYPIQGSAFHVMLQCIIWMDEIMRKEKWRSRICNQIYDDLMIDTHPSEISMVIDTLRYIMTDRIKKHWPWIIVPLDVEIATTEVDASWYTLKELK